MIDYLLQLRSIYLYSLLRCIEWPTLIGLQASAYFGNVVGLWSACRVTEFDFGEGSFGTPKAGVGLCSKKQTKKIMRDEWRGEEKK